MAHKGKGKAFVDKWSSGKRKRGEDGEFSPLNRRNPGVLKLCDVVADADGSSGSDDSDFDDDLFEEVLETNLKGWNGSGKAQNIPFFPKEEELSGEDFERVLEVQYRDGSGLISDADDKYDSKRSEKNYLMPSDKDPTIWKVKCMIGREKHSAFCLMQKYVDLKALGTKLQIVSAFSVEYISGYIFIEADKQFDINEACNGLCSIYAHRVAPVPKNEVSHFLSIRNKSSGLSLGTWVRVKNGNYKGDLAEVVAVNDARKRATIRLIPRINLQALIDKLGGGVPLKNTNVQPAPRLISSRELEEFQPLIQRRLDRETGMVFEVLDGLMLKDGFLYKKVSIESLNLWGVMPSQEELDKFHHSTNEQSEHADWLKQIFGEKKKKHSHVINLKHDKGGDKGGGKGKGTSKPDMDGFGVHDFVCIGRKDFGVIVGIEKDDSYKILKEGPKGQVVVTAALHDLKNAPFDKKFTALDKKMKTVSINDIVRVLDGPSQGRQGTIKQIYRGILFLHDENEIENCGLFCCRSLICEKVNLSGEACCEKADELKFGNFSTSPESPLSSKKSLETGKYNNNFKQGDRDGLYSVGQSLRIKKGPLKGYLCHVLAVCRSNVTVKLNSQPKVLTVDAELLSVVLAKNSASMDVDPESGSMKPFELLGMPDGSTDWMKDASTAGSSSWNSVQQSERSSWSMPPTLSSSFQPDFNAADPIVSVDNGSKIDGGDDSWGEKVISKQDTSLRGSEETGGWGAGSRQDDGLKSEDPWDKAKHVSANSGGWGLPEADTGADETGGWGADSRQDDGLKSEDPWDKVKHVSANSGGWGLPEAENKGLDKTVNGDQLNKCEDVAGWAKAESSNKEQINSWKNPVKVADGGSWGKQDGASFLQKEVGSSSWNKAAVNANETWSKPESFKEDQGNDWNTVEASGASANSGLSGWDSKLSTNEASHRTQKPSWGKEPATNVEAGGAWDNAGGSSAEFQNKPWSTETATADGNQSVWNSKGSWGSQKASEEKNSDWNGNSAETVGNGWNRGKPQEDGSSSGWGQSNIWKSKVSEALNGFQNNTSHSNWSEDGSENFGYRGRGGRGRGRFNQSGFGGRSSFDRTSLTGRNAKESVGAQGSGWGEAKASGWRCGSSAGIGSSDWDIKASNANDPEAHNGIQESGWKKREGDKDQHSGWWNANGGKVADGDEAGEQGSGWGGKKASDGSDQIKKWGTGEAADWSQKGNRSSSTIFGSGQSAAPDDQGVRNRVRGGNWRGGRGRGGYNDGGFRGRGRSDGGGFRGGGRFDRGRGCFEGSGYGGRGWGRSQGRGGWNSNENQGSQEGWKRDGAGSSWNSGGGGGSWKQCTPGNDTPSSWKQQGADGNDSVDSWKGGGNVSLMSWGKGGGSSWQETAPVDDAPSSWKQGSAPPPVPDSSCSWGQGWKASATPADGGSTWKQGTGQGVADGAASAPDDDDPNTWKQGSAPVPAPDSSSSWGQGWKASAAPADGGSTWKQGTGQGGADGAASAPDDDDSNTWKQGCTPAPGPGSSSSWGQGWKASARPAVGGSTWKQGTGKGGADGAASAPDDDDPNTWKQGSAPAPAPDSSSSWGQGWKVSATPADGGSTWKQGTGQGGADGAASAPDDDDSNPWKQGSVASTVNLGDGSGDALSGSIGTAPHDSSSSWIQGGESTWDPHGDKGSGWK